MDYVGSLWKRGYRWSPPGNSSPKAVTRSSGKERSNSGRIDIGSSPSNIDASQEDVSSRGDTDKNTYNNSPRHERTDFHEGDFDDVLGGPPRYAFSKKSLQAPVHGHEKAFFKPSNLSPGWKDSDFPVFGSSPHSSGFQAAGSPHLRPKSSSRSSSRVQSPARPPSSLVRSLASDELLASPVHLRIDPKEILSPREAAGMASVSSTADIPAGRTSAQDLYGSDELISCKGRGAEYKGAHHVTSSKSRNKSYEDYQDLDRSSQSVVGDGEDSNSVLRQSEMNDGGSYIEGETLGMKLPRVFPEPLCPDCSPDCSPRLKNQRSFLRKKFGMEPSKDSCRQAFTPPALAKESLASPSSNFSSTATVRSSSNPLSRLSTWSDSALKTDMLDKRKDSVLGQHISSSSCSNDEGNATTKNRQPEHQNKDFDHFSSAVAAQEFMSGEGSVIGVVRLSERQGCSSPDICIEDKDDKVNLSKIAQKTVDSLKNKSALNSLLRERQDRKTRFSHEVLEKEELEAREAVERERRLRHEQRQKARERQDIKEPLERVSKVAEKLAAAEMPDAFKRAVGELSKKGMTTHNKKILEGEKSVTSGKLEAEILARSQVLVEMRAEAENFANFGEDANVGGTVSAIKLTKTVEDIQAAIRDQKLTNQFDENQTSLNSASNEKGGQNSTAVHAENGSTEESVDIYPPASEDDGTEEKTACSGLNQQTSNHVGLTELLDEDINKWSSGKERNLRALLSTLQYVLWSESGWRPVHLTDIISPISVKKVYKKATLCVHPDKMQQKGASLQQKYIAERVFFLLKEAWNTFNSEEFL